VTFSPSPSQRKIKSFFRKKPKTATEDHRNIRYSPENKEKTITIKLTNNLNILRKKKMDRFFNKTIDITSNK